MLEFLPTADDVIALRITGKITGADLDAIMDRLEPMLERHEKVHVFVETRGIDGIELAGLGTYTSRAMPLFGKLTRFGRVAVVADQAWIRWGTRIESAILPFISYRTYLPDQSEFRCGDSPDLWPGHLDGCKSSLFTEGRRDPAKCQCAQDRESCDGAKHLLRLRSVPIPPAPFHGASRLTTK